MEVIKVLSDSSVPEQGGYYYDIAIAEYFADEIDKLEIREGKPTVREDKIVM